MDFRLFHLYLYENKNNFYLNGILYDCFNFDFFYNYSKRYSTAKEGDFDLKYFITLYLYKSLFQNVEYIKVRKNQFAKKLILNHIEII